MEIIQQIGINQTAFIQFAIFTITLIYLTYFVFKPYAAALEQREGKTKGGEDLALELQKQAIELQKTYETKAKALNEQIKTIFDTEKSAASKDADVLIGHARSQAETLVESNRQQLTQAVQAIAGDLKAQTSSVALAITQKLIGK